MSSNNLTLEVVDRMAFALSEYFYALADVADEDGQRNATYMDAADALTDVIEMWGASGA